MNLYCTLDNILSHHTLSTSYLKKIKFWSSIIILYKCGNSMLKRKWKLKRLDLPTLWYSDHNFFGAIPFFRIVHGYWVTGHPSWPWGVDTITVPPPLETHFPITTFSCNLVGINSMWEGVKIKNTYKIKLLRLSGHNYIPIFLMKSLILETKSSTFLWIFLVPLLGKWLTPPNLFKE